MSAASPNRVSVVIAAFNNWPDLELAIQSALCQSHRPAEVIVVDNGSQDETELNVHSRFGSAVVYIRQDNRGDAGAYNTGLARSAGDFIQFLDGDDVLAATKLEKQLRVFAEFPEADIVYGDMRFFQTSPGAASWHDWDVGQGDIWEMLLTPGRHMFGTHSLLFRRQVFETVGVWREGCYVADLDLWLRAAAAGCVFRYCPGSLYFHRVRAGQMSANLPMMLRAREEVWERAKSYAPERDRRRLDGLIAQSRFWRALRDEAVSTREAVRMIWSSHAACPSHVSFAAAVGATAVRLLPFRHVIVKARGLARLRRALAGMAGLP